MAIQAKIEGNKLVITCDLDEPVPSASGKTLVVASTRGNMKTDLLIHGKPLTIGLNAYIPQRKHGFYIFRFSAGFTRALRYSGNYPIC